MGADDTAWRGGGVPSTLAHVRARTTLRLVLPIMVAVCAEVGVAHADGVYGRLDRDFVLSAGAGGGYDTSAQAVWLGELRLRYLDTAGVLAGIEGHGSALRVVVAGDFRPLFLVRFLLDEWSGRAWLDLLIDSIGLELGAAFDRLTEDERGVALAIGFGIDVPLVLPGALLDGLVLRLGARHARASPHDVRGPGQLADWTFYGALVIRGTVDLGVAEREPPRFRPER